MLASIVIACASLPTQAAMSAHRALNFTAEIAKFDNVPLDTVIDYIHDETEANIHVNWKALEAVGVSKDAQVNLNLRKVPVHKLLDLALEEAGAGTALTYYVDQGVIEITTREIADASMITRVYPVDDLLMEIPDFTDAPDFNITSNNTQTSGSGGGGGGGGGGQGLFGGGSSSSGSGSQTQQLTTKTDRAQALIELIMQTLQPEIWQPNGGQATIHFFNGSLIVRAPRSIQEALGGPVD
jgi:uncharacterized membrane protein YgcG